jgi:hypothetical protein
LELEEECNKQIAFQYFELEGKVLSLEFKLAGVVQNTQFDLFGKIAELRSRFKDLE